MGERIAGGMLRSVAKVRVRVVIRLAHIICQSRGPPIMGRVVIASSASIRTLLWCTGPFATTIDASSTTLAADRITSPIDYTFTNSSS